MDFAMDNFRLDYKEMHTELSSFVKDLSTRYVSDAPSELQDVKVIPTIMLPNDADITAGNVDNIVTKASVVLDVTREVLALIPPFVQAGSQSWLQGQSNDLKFWLSVVEMNLLNLQISNSNIDGTTIISSGISGINTGVQNGMSYESLTRLQNLVTVLRAGPS